ncbi:hypothetical protein [Mycolicibacterium sarraceniae]|uniref:hypothetical protein n=1 Tax=Mycolicibacterium sarraceniae TaxID=1534348 RepID=UPI001F45C840|nr:hypothetical protein [Mycolicibacterium sarraceniae]
MPVGRCFRQLLGFGDADLVERRFAQPAHPVLGVEAVRPCRARYAVVTGIPSLL